MPKAKPSQVIVHRIELQEREREMLEQLVIARTVRDVALPATVAAGVGVAGYIGYKAAKAAFGWAEDAVDDLREIVDEKIMEPVLGKKEYTDPDDGKTYKNPLAGIPVLGSLFGSGINIGIATKRKAKRDAERRAEQRANDPRYEEGGHPAYDNYGQPKTYESREDMYGV